MAMSLVGCGNSSKDTKSTTKNETRAAQTETETLEETTVDETEEATEEETTVEATTVPETSKKLGSGKVLVAYFTLVDNVVKKNDTAASSSKTINGDTNAEYIANMVKDATDGELFEILVKKKYPADYDDVADMAEREQAENIKPKLKRKVNNMSDYDTVILVYPIWWGTLPTPIVSFVSSHDLKGKTVLAISTAEGSGVESSVEDLKALAKGANVEEGLSIMTSNVANSSNIVDRYLKNHLN